MSTDELTFSVSFKLCKWRQNFYVWDKNLSPLLDPLEYSLNWTNVYA